MFCNDFYFLWLYQGARTVFGFSQEELKGIWSTYSLLWRNILHKASDLLDKEIAQGTLCFTSLAEESWIGHRSNFISFSNIIFKNEQWLISPVPWGFWHKKCSFWKVRNVKEDFSPLVEWDYTLSKMLLPVSLLRFQTVHVKHDRHLLSSVSKELYSPAQYSQVSAKSSTETGGKIFFCSFSQLFQNMIMVCASLPV